MPVPFIQLNPVSNQDAGTAAILSALTNALSTQAYTANSKRSMLADLLGKGITAGGTMLGNGIGFLASQNQARNTLQTAGELGVIPPLSEEQLKRGIAQSGANSIVTQAGYNAMLGRGAKLASIGDSTAKSGDPRSDIAYDEAAKIVEAYQNRNPGTTTTTAAPAASVDTNGEAMTQEYTPGKPLKGGVTSAPVSAEPQNLVAQTAKIDKDTKALKLQGEKIAQAVTSPDYLYGPGNTSGAQVKNNPVQAIDPAGIPLDTNMTEGLAAARQKFASNSAQGRATVADSVTDAATTLDDFTSLRDNVLKYRKQGLFSRLGRKVLSDGTMQYLIPDNAPDEMVSTIVYLNNSYALATKLVKATGQTGTGISNRDVQSYQDLVGNPNVSEKLFIQQSNDYISKNLVDSLRKSALVDGAQFNAIKKVYETRTGLKLPDDFMTNTKFLTNTRDALNTQMGKQASESGKAALTRAMTPTATPTRPVVSPVTRPTVAPVARPSSSTKNNLTDVEKILQQYGRI